MIKYGDCDEQHLEEKIAEVKEKAKSGEKVAEEAIPLEELLDKTKRERLRED